MNINYLNSMLLKKTIYFPIFLLLCSFPKLIYSCEVLFAYTVCGAAIGCIASVYLYISCLFVECCNDSWIRLNATELSIALDKKLYGQHLVKKVVVKHIKAHFEKQPSKALSLSFHGTTGTGKNYVSQIIAENVFSLGMRSQFVHVLPSTKEFQHENMVPQYKEQLKDLIEKSTAKCERSMFIFDEMDKMPPGLIDVVKPYLDFYDHLDGVDYRKAIFIFLSNTAANEISNYALDHLRTGQRREEIKLSDMEQLVNTAAGNTKDSGLWHSDLITKHMISASVPFLPLERRHIKLCITDKIMEKKIYKHVNHIGEDKIQEVLSELSFYPENEKVFSVTGCKRVTEKVDYVFEELDSY